MTRRPVNRDLLQSALVCLSPPAWAQRGGLTLAAMLAVLLLPVSAQDGQRAGGQDAESPAPGVSPAAAEEPRAGQVTDPRTRVARRLLRLRQGNVLRAQTRWSGEHWEFFHEGAWESLHPALVESDRLEADALGEAARRRAKVRRDDAGGLAAHATWLIETGLYAEGLRLLEDVLRLDADQPAAMALLHDDALPVRVPSLAVPRSELAAARAELLRFASVSPLVVQELALVELATLPEDPELLAELRSELNALLVDTSAQSRAFAALALRRLMVPVTLQQTEVEECLRRAVRDSSDDVRVQASLALRDVRQEGLIVPVVASLGSTSRAVRVNAAESLGLMGYPAAVPPLMEQFLSLRTDGGGGGSAPRANVFVGSQIAYVAGFSVDVAQNAAIGNPEIGTLQEGASLDVSVLATTDSEGYLRESKALRTALTRLTGVDPGPTKSAWKAWWSRHQEGWPGAQAAVTGAGAPPGLSR